MRNLVKPILLGCGLGMVVIVLLEGVLRAQSTNKPAAMVNGVAITLEEVDSIIRSKGPQLAPLTTTQLRQIRMEILNGLIDEALVRDFLKQKGPKVDPAEIDRSIAALEAAQKAQNKTLADYFRESNQTESQLRAGIEMMLKLSGYLAKQMSDEQLKAYFDANKDHFEKVTVRAAHIVLRVAASSPASEREAAKKKMMAIHAEIVAGKKEFADAAREFSQCPTAPKGGEIGYIARKWQVDDRFSKAAFNLKVNEVSDVVETDFGVHLVKCLERTAGTPTKFELVKDEVRDCFSEDWRQQTIAELRAKAKIEIMLP
jgi:parvulin-like peptidyl-prolyl isomerase